jgi:hypothetical protein
MAIIALLVVYIIVLFFRMRRLQRSMAAVPPLTAQSAVAAYSAIQEPQPAAVAAVKEVPQAESEASPASVQSSARLVSGKPEFAWNEPPPEIPGQALIDALQRELYQLRCEVDELRAELLATREDFRRQFAQSAGPAQGASPMYNDAMQLAIQGHDATTIAHHCGIARAEADLVVALARNRHEGL